MRAEVTAALVGTIIVSISLLASLVAVISVGVCG